MKSIIRLYQSNLREESNYIIDDIEVYLAQLPHKTDAQETTISVLFPEEVATADLFDIKIENSVLFSLSKYNYARVQNNESSSDKRVFYYFVKGVRYDSSDRAIITLKLDTLNTYMNSVSFLPTTLVKREHIDRWDYNYCYTKNGIFYIKRKIPETFIQENTEKRILSVKNLHPDNVTDFDNRNHWLKIIVDNHEGNLPIGYHFIPWNNVTVKLNGSDIKGLLSYVPESSGDIPDMRTLFAHGNVNKISIVPYGPSKELVGKTTATSNEFKVETITLITSQGTTTPTKIYPTAALTFSDSLLISTDEDYNKTSNSYKHSIFLDHTTFNGTDVASFNKLLFGALVFFRQKSDLEELKNHVKNNGFFDPNYQEHSPLEEIQDNFTCNEPSMLSASYLELSARMGGKQLNILLERFFFKNLQKFKDMVDEYISDSIDIDEKSALLPIMFKPLLNESDGCILQFGKSSVYADYKAFPKLIAFNINTTLPQINDQYNTFIKQGNSYLKDKDLQEKFDAAAKGGGGPIDWLLKQYMRFSLNLTQGTKLASDVSKMDLGNYGYYGGGNYHPNTLVQDLIGSAVKVGVAGALRGPVTAGMMAVREGIRTAKTLDKTPEVYDSEVKGSSPEVILVTETDTIAKYCISKTEEEQTTLEMEYYLKGNLINEYKIPTHNNRKYFDYLECDPHFDFSNSEIFSDEIKAVLCSKLREGVFFIHQYKTSSWVFPTDLKENIEKKFLEKLDQQN